MAGQFPPRARNAMLEGFAAVVTHITAFEDNPGATDTPAASEVVGARIPVDWDAAAAGQLDQTGTDVLTINAGASANYVGFYNALTGGLYYGAIDTTDEMFTSEGDLDVSALAVILNNAA